MASQVPANDEGVRCVSTGQSTTAKKAAAVGQACQGVWESVSSGSDAWRANPPTRMLIRNEDAARVTVPSGVLAKRNEVTLSSMILGPLASHNQIVWVWA